MDIPVLETERLILRAHTVDDFDELATMWADAGVVRHIGGHQSTRAEAWERLLRYRGLWPLLGFGYWAVFEKGENRYAGDVGFADYHRVITPSMDGEPETGWVLGPHAQGRGIATEALTAAFEWFDNAFPGRNAVCIIDPENKPSVSLARKLGFSLQCETRFRGDPTLFMRRSPPIPPAPC